MGHKVHPVGFRLGVIRDWQARWFAAKPRTFRTLLLEDLSFRKAIWERYPDAGVAKIEIERGAHLADVGGGEVDGDATPRKLEA